MRPLKFVTLDITDMDACHVLIGRPWQYDRSAHHDGQANTYSLQWGSKKIVLLLTAFDPRVPTLLPNSPHASHNVGPLTPSISSIKPKLNHIPLVQSTSAIPFKLFLAIVLKDRQLEHPNILVSIQQLIDEFKDLSPEELP